jgi:hypothetical protein
MTTIERSEALRAIAFGVALELGHPWTYTEQDAEHCAAREFIQNKDTGMKVFFGLSSSKGYELCDRVEVSGHLNIGKNNAYVTLYEGSSRVAVPSISVARARGAVAIAKAITSRFLPEYTRIYNLALAKVSADNDYDTQVTTNLQRLAKASGTVISDSDSRCGGFRNEVRTSYSLSIGEVYGTVTASTDTAELGLRCLTMEQAEHILQYLKGNKGKQTRVHADDEGSF